MCKWFVLPVYLWLMQHPLRWSSHEESVALIARSEPDLWTIQHI
jgi:hypothetical protein